jgi:hypothetical protein
MNDPPCSFSAAEKKIATSKKQRNRAVNIPIKNR